MNDVFGCLQEFSYDSRGKFFSLMNLEKSTSTNIRRLPLSLKLMLENLLRNYDDKKIKTDHILNLLNWSTLKNSTKEIPFIPSRIILQDYSGIPLLGDLVAMREAAHRFGINPQTIGPQLPTTLVIDHSLQTDHTRSKDSSQLNMEKEFERNTERYKFIKWAGDTFENLTIIPPGTGILHQINLEYLSPGVLKDKNGIYHPDSVIGTDSHTPMINGIGVIGWGVGGIEAEAALLGQPLYISIPDVIGVNLSGHLKEGTTATDLALTLTELLRKNKVTGKIVEYLGEGVQTLTAEERATIANMAPEYGALMGLFPIDESVSAYYKKTGKSEESVKAFEAYYKAQGLYGIPQIDKCVYSHVINFNLSTVLPSISGPRRPQDRVNLSQIGNTFKNEFQNFFETRTSTETHFGKEKTTSSDVIKDGDILIAAITSCTNTSNPKVMLAAGLLAKKACERGLLVSSRIKTSLTPGSQSVTAYLKEAGLLEYLEQLGFALAGYGCATCIGNVGKLSPEIELVLNQEQIVAAAVLSGNRNFESRIHPRIKANFLMSPPLVVAFALAGTVNINLEKSPLGYDSHGEPVFLKDIWPSTEEVEKAIFSSKQNRAQGRQYKAFSISSDPWERLSSSQKGSYEWDPGSSYISESPFFREFSPLLPSLSNIYNAKALAIFGDSITTDHISPVGPIEVNSPAGRYLLMKGILPRDFNNFGARRGCHEVMTRGTFSNPQLKNQMLPKGEGGFTKTDVSSPNIINIYDAAMLYQYNNTPTLIIAGEEYGTGSARDWAAKGTKLLGVKVVIAKSFERIHRSNLIGMGVLPCQFNKYQDPNWLNLDGSETFDILGIEALGINKKLMLVIRKGDVVKIVKITALISNEVELEYFKNGGILPYMLRKILVNTSRLDTLYEN